MSRAPVPAVRVEHLTLREGGTLVLRDVSLTVETGTIYALLGGREATGALLRCLAGMEKPSEGQVSVLGRDPLARWRLRGRRAFLTKERDSGSSLAAEASRGRARELLLLEAPQASIETAATLRSLASRGTAIVLATDRAVLAETAADRIAVIARGRILTEGPPREVASRFRRIHYANRLTESRTEFGTELDAFHAVGVRVRGWGITALVSDFDETSFEHFRRLDGVENARAEAVTLDEVLSELSGRPESGR